MVFILSLSLGYHSLQVALTALGFWQDTYVVTLQGLPSSSRQGAIGAHTPLLQHLTSSLVLRGQLGAATAASATADARDLPEEVRMVRTIVVRLRAGWCRLSSI
jgi:hypothetical protein